MKTSIYLVLNRRGVVKMTQKKVPLETNERGIRLSITVDDAVFCQPPDLDAQLDIPVDQLIHPDPPEPLRVEIWSTEP